MVAGGINPEEPKPGMGTPCCPGNPCYKEPNGIDDTGEDGDLPITRYDTRFYTHLNKGELAGKHVVARSS